MTGKTGVGRCHMGSSYSLQTTLVKTLQQRYTVDRLTGHICQSNLGHRVILLMITLNVMLLVIS